MGAKYEVIYWDWQNGKEVTEENTNSFVRAMLLVRKLEKQYHCVSIKFRRGKIK